MDSQINIHLMVPQQIVKYAQLQFGTCHIVATGDLIKSGSGDHI